MANELLKTNKFPSDNNIKVLIKEKMREMNEDKYKELCHLNDWKKKFKKIMSEVTF